MRITLQCPMCKIGFDMEIESDDPQHRYYAKWIGDNTQDCPNCDESITIDVCVWDKAKDLPF